MISDFQKLQYYDLKFEAKKYRLLPCIGREEEIQRLSRIVSRQSQNNALIVAPSGSGKTALLDGWAMTASKNPAFQNLHIVSINIESLQKAASQTIASITRCHEALATLKDTVVVLDNFGLLFSAHNNSLQAIESLFRPLLTQTGTQYLLKQYAGFGTPDF